MSLVNLKSANNKIWFSLLLLIFILVSFFLINFLKKSNPSNKPITIFTLENCNIQKTDCTFTAENMTLELSMQKDIYYLKPFDLSIKELLTDSYIKDNSAIESIVVDFKMKNMDMGVNRFKLKKQKLAKGTSSVWEGKALLPICVTGRAGWVTELDILTNDSHYRLVFPIVVKQAP